MAFHAWKRIKVESWACSEWRGNGAAVVRRLLEEMDYQNVEVTTRSRDGGVEAIVEIELGITSAREVV